MVKKVVRLYSAFCTQPAFYSQSAICILHSVCILLLFRSLQSAFYTDGINNSLEEYKDTSTSRARLMSLAM